MLLQNATLPSSLSTTPLTATNLNWQVGQILHAIVQGRDQQGLLHMKIGGNLLAARTAQIYQPGQTLRLQVIENKGSLVLRDLVPGKLRTKRPMLEQLLRHALPKQGNLQTMAKSLNQLLSKLNAPSQDMATLPKTLIKQLLNTQSVLPKAELVVEPLALKQAIRDSGLFMEAKLAATLSSTDKTSANAIKTDLKATLIKLLHVLEQSLQVRKTEMTPAAKTPAQAQEKPLEQHPAQKQAQITIDGKAYELMELRNVVESAIARIQVNQSQAVVTEDQSKPIWIIDLPILDDQRENLAELKIQYEDTQAQLENPPRKWIVNLSLDIAPLGMIHVQLNLLGEALSSSIWAEQAFTNTLITQNLPTLEKRLQQSGLNVVSINHHPIKQRGPADKQQHSSLLSTKI